MTEEPITVLCVDDDEGWARYVASELEAEDSSFAVTVALNANEAIVALDGDDAIDCVVADYRMPEINGIQLLEHVRESRSHLPFILVTGGGSEDVAARAIEAGVTDYLRKDPRVDQTSTLANRVRQAVERSRLRAVIRESEHRYRTVVERTRDAIVIVQCDEIVFANDRFRELCGLHVGTEPRESSIGADSPDATADPNSSDAFLAHVHEDDRGLVTDLVETTRSGNDSGLREIRLVRPTGEVRYCELLGDVITYETDAATLLSIRDVTHRRGRERTLARDLAFNQAVRKLLISVRNRDELESEITNVLTDYGYDLAWIGTVDERGVHTRVTAGDDEYVTRLEAGSTGTGHGGDPIHWSARTGDPQFVPDFEALIPTDRRNETGVRAHP